MGDILEQRRLSAAARLGSLQSDLRDAAELARDKACVYVTGSFARGDASSHSDLDLFIVGRTADGPEKKRLLKSLDETCVKADLIRMTRRRGFPDFSGDGTYLTHYTVDELISALGTPEDDSQNTFTARLLLLLESKPLFGNGVYQQAIAETIASYWRDYEGHEDTFLPAFLCNDILRLWRTFCVNYEARTRNSPSIEKAKRQLKKHKLKHSRLLTCYSAFLFLIDAHNEKGTVQPEDAERMVSLTPTLRIEYLLEKSTARACHQQLSELISTYKRFLSDTDAPETELANKILDGDFRSKMFRSEDEFGTLMYTALRILGSESKLYQMLVV